MLIGAKHFRNLAATSFFVGRFRIRAPYNVAMMALAGRWQGIRGYLRGLWEGSALRAERLWPAARGVGDGGGPKVLQAGGVSFRPAGSHRNRANRSPGTVSPSLPASTPGPARM